MSLLKQEFRGKPGGMSYPVIRMSSTSKKGDRKPIFGFVRFWCALLIIPAIVMPSLAANYPAATERIYSTGIYPELSAFIAQTTGFFSFSLFEFIIIILPVSLIAYIIIKVRRIIKLPDSRGDNALRLALTLLCVTGVVGFGFAALCGLNYHRESFAASSGLSVRPSTAEELAELCAELTQKTNEYAAIVKRDENNNMVSSFKSYYEAAGFAPAAYLNAAGEYPLLGGYTPRVKPVFASRVMSVLDIVGIYFPFTFEANINIDVPAYEIPAAMLHELAHYKGFMREDEANFIAYKASLVSGNDDFAYSGLMLALVHSTNALYSADRDAYWELTQQFDDGITADLNANAAYWKQFEGPVADFSEKVNDVYLKTNRQTAGVKSYGRMVDLLLAQYRKDNNIE